MGNMKCETNKIFQATSSQVIGMDGCAVKIEELGSYPVFEEANPSLEAETQVKVNTLWVGAGVAGGLLNEPGQLSGAVYDITQRRLPENAGVTQDFTYENHVRRSLTQYIRYSVLTGSSPVLSHPESLAFESVLDEFYAETSENDDIYIHQRVLPYDLSENELLPVLNRSQVKHYPDLAKYYDTVSSVQDSLSSNNILHNIDGIRDLLVVGESSVTEENAQVFDELDALEERIQSKLRAHILKHAPGAGQFNHLSTVDFITAYQSYLVEGLQADDKEDMVIQQARLLEFEALQNQILVSDRELAGLVIGKLSHLKWNDAPLFSALRQKNEALKDLFYDQMHKVTYQADLLRGDQRYTLPDELRYHANVPFDDLYSKALYDSFFGESILTEENPVAYKMGEVSGELELSVVSNSAQQNRVPTSDSSAAILNHYRTVVLPQIEADVEAINVSGPLAVLTEFDIPIKDNVDQRKKQKEVDQWTLASPDRYKAKLKRMAEYVDHSKADRHLMEYQNANNVSWKQLIARLVSDYSVESLKGLIEQLNLKESGDIQRLQGAINAVYANAINYIEGIETFTAINIALAKLYEELIELQVHNTQAKMTPELKQKIENRALTIWKKMVEQLLYSLDESNISRESNIYSREMISRYKKVSIHLESLIQNENKKLLLPLKVSLNKAERVLSVAESRMNLPKDLERACKANANYQAYKETFVTEFSEWPNLVQAFTKYSLAKIPEEQWIGAVKSELSYGAHSTRVTYALEKVKDKLSSLESYKKENLKDHQVYFHPSVEVEIINRAREVVFSIDYQSRVLKQFESDKNSEFQDVIKRDLGRWAEALPEGYPTKTYNKDEFQSGVDNFHHITIEAMVLILSGQGLPGVSEYEQEQKVFNFFTHEDGYFDYFKLSYKLSNKFNIAWAGINEMDGLCKFLNLVNYWQDLLQYKTGLTEKEKLAQSRLQRVSDLIREKLAQHNEETEIMTLLDGSRRIIFTKYNKLLPVSKRLQQSVEDRAILTLHSWDQDLVSLYKNDVRNLNFWTHFKKGSYSELVQNIDGEKYEKLLDHLNEPELQANIDKLTIDGFDDKTAAYFLGRLMDRKFAKSQAHDSIQWNKITHAIERLSPDDIDLIVEFLESGTSAQRSWPRGLSHDAYKIIGSIDLNSSQKLWVWGFCKMRSGSDDQESAMHSSDSGSDVMYAEYLSRDLIERLLDDKNTVEYEEYLLVKVNELLQQHGSEKIDQESFEVLSATQKIKLFKTVYSNVDLHSEMELQHNILSRIHPQGENYLLPDDLQKEYALLFISISLSSNPSQDDIKRLESLRYEIGGATALTLKKEINALSLENKKRLYTFTRHQIKKDYQKRIGLFLETAFNDNYALTQYWQFLCQVIESPAVYLKSDGKIDFQKFVRDFDDVIQNMVQQDDFEFNSDWESVLRTSSQELSSILSRDSKNPSLQKVSDLISHIPAMAYGSYLESDERQAARHSRFNPNGYSIAPGALAHYDLDDLCDSSFIKRMHQLNHERFHKSMSEVGRIQKVLLNVRSAIQPPYDSNSITIGNMSLVVNADHGFVFETPDRHVAASYDDSEALQLAKVCFALFQPVLKHFEGSGLFRYPVSQITNKDAMDAMQSLMARPRERQMVEQYFQHLSQGLDDTESVEYVARNFHYFKGVALVIKTDRPESIDLSYQDLEWTLNGIESLLNEKIGINGGQTAQLFKQGEKDG